MKAGLLEQAFSCSLPDPSPVIPPESYQLLVVAQNLSSITCVFFSNQVTPSGTLVIQCNNSETPPCPEQVPGDKGCRE